MIHASTIRGFGGVAALTTIDGTFVSVEAETRLDLVECSDTLPAWYELSAFTPGP